MARLYSRKRGKSSSKKPEKSNQREWTKYSTREIEELVVKYAKKGYTTSMIGTILRDSYGIADIKEITGKSILKILKERDLAPEIPEDLTSLINKAKRLEKHFKKFPKDLTAKRGIQLTESKIRRLAKYYIKRGILPENWKYKRGIKL